MKDTYYSYLDKVVVMRDGSSWLSGNRASRANDPEFISDDFIENLMVECIQRLFPITLLERDREYGYYALASSWIDTVGQVAYTERNHNAKERRHGLYYS